MKKALSLLLVSALIVASLSGCVGSAREDAIGELGSSYSADEYYELQQKEIDDIIAEYTDKINEAKSKDEIASLKQECIDKINAVDNKEAALENAKAYAQECLDSIKGKLLPYKEAAAAINGLREKLETDEPAEIITASDELKSIVDASSDTGVFHYNLDGLSFDVTYKYSVDEDGLPVFTVSSTEKWKEIKWEDKDCFIQILCELIVNTAIDNPSIERMLSCNGFFFGLNSFGFLDETYVPFNDPSKARMSFLDDNTIEIHALTKEQMDEFNSNSETFVNSDGETVKRDVGDKDPMNYIALTAFTKDTSDKEYMDKVPFILVM